MQLFVETLPNSVQHRIAEIDDDHPLDNTAELSVPAGQLVATVGMAMGDSL